MEQTTCMLQNPNVNNSLSSSNSMSNQMLSNLQPSLQGLYVTKIQNSCSADDFLELRTN